MPLLAPVLLCIKQSLAWCDTWVTFGLLLLRTQSRASQRYLFWYKYLYSNVFTVNIEAQKQENSLRYKIKKIKNFRATKKTFLI